jgi:hypothetical protein
MSVLDPFLVRFRAAASALCGFRLCFGGVGDVGEGRFEPWGDEALSDDVDMVRDPIGTVRLLRLGVEVPGVAVAAAG